MGIIFVDVSGWGLKAIAFCIPQQKLYTPKTWYHFFLFFLPLFYLFIQLLNVKGHKLHCYLSHRGNSFKQK